MEANGDSTEFLEKLEAGGRKTALSSRPVLEEEELELWKMYTFTAGDNLLHNLDIYSRYIGLPYDWSFEESALLVSKIAAKSQELKLDKKGTS